MPLSEAKVTRHGKSRCMVYTLLIKADRLTGGGGRLEFAEATPILSANHGEQDQMGTPRHYWGNILTYVSAS